MEENKMKEFFKSFQSLFENFFVEREDVQKSSDEIEEQISIEVVYEPDTEDAHGQWMSKDTIQKGCEDFNKHLSEGVVQPNLYHLENTDKFEIVKSWIHEELDVTVDATGEPVKAGTWLAKVHYKDPNLWKLKKEGAIQGVSVFGHGNINEETGEITNLTFSGETE